MHVGHAMYGKVLVNDARLWILGHPRGSNLVKSASHPRANRRGVIPPEVVKPPDTARA